MHLCKCNDVAELTSIIKIRLKKLIPRIWHFKVIGTDMDRSTTYVFYSNFVSKTHRF